MPSHGKYFIGGNWKCNGTKEKIAHLVGILEGSNFDEEKVDVVVAPSALHLSLVQDALSSTQIQLCSQNVSLTGCGAFTGEIAATQLVDFGLSWTLTGHSERRSLYGESDSVVAAKTKLAYECGLNVILCIGESLTERQTNQTLQVLYRQMKAVVDVLPIDAWSNIVVAYEPVWAIGTGVVATPAQAQEVHNNLRQWVSTNLSPAVASTLRIIYGGSVNAANCGELIGLADVDGFLVGGASLKSEFLKIIECAKD